MENRWESAGNLRQMVNRQGHGSLSYRNYGDRKNLSLLVELYHDNLTVKRMSHNEGGERTLFLLSPVKHELQKVLLAKISTFGFDNYGASLMLDVLR